MTEYMELEVEMNGHKENVEVAVVQLEDRADMFMGHDWLVRHNLEIDWNKGTIRFSRCPPECDVPHQEITFTPKIRRLIPQDDIWEDEEEPDPTNPEDLPEYA